MRIGFDAKRYFHNQTGLGNYSRSLINGFREFHPEHSYFLFSPKANQSGEHIITKKKTSLFWRQLGIANAIEKQKLDVYHGLSAELPYVKTAKTRLVVTIHDLIFMKYPGFYKTIDRFLYSHKMSNALKKADRIIAASEQTKIDLEQIVGDSNKIQVIYQDCDPMFYQKHIPEELAEFRDANQLPRDFLLMVSKFEKRKNHLRLLEAIQSNSDLDMPLVLVGRPGDTLNEVESFVATHGLEKQITIQTSVASSDLPKYYQLASGSLFPSEYEGFGIPVLESLACGTPVLTSKGSSMEEICREAALYIDPIDVESISNGLALFSETTRRTTLEQAIPERLPHFSNTHILEEHLELYSNLL